jgi:hypothetical protein
VKTPCAVVDEGAPVTDLVADLPVVEVIVLFLGGLCLLQAGAHVSQKLLVFHHGLGDRENPGVVGLIRADRRGVARP